MNSIKKDCAAMGVLLGTLGTVFALLGSFLIVGVVCGGAALGLGLFSRRGEDGAKKSGLCAALLGGAALAVSAVFLLLALIGTHG